MRETTFTIDPSQYGEKDADGCVTFKPGETFEVDADDYLDLKPLFGEEDAAPVEADLARAIRELQRPVPNVQEALICLDRAVPEFRRMAGISSGSGDK